MTLCLAFALNYLLIDIGLGLTALLLGIGGTLLYVRHTNPAGKAGEPSREDRVLQQIYQNERAAMAAQNLRDLAENMANDVGAHCELMNGITHELGAIESSSVEGQAVGNAVARILKANGDLQNRLEEAERKIAAQAEEIRNQQSEARTDSLTQLSNRRAFDDAVRANLDAFHREGRPYSLMLFDVDHFKDFNDTHGHQAGDEVLRSVGATLQRVVNAGDLPCRYGGEEFAVVMPNTRVRDARVAAERVRSAVEKMAVEFEGKTLKVTASVGVAQILPSEPASMLIRRADDAVYASKNAGRNNGHWHSGDDCLPLDVDAKAPAMPMAEQPDESHVLPAQGFGDRYRKLADERVLLDELGRRISESHRFGVPVSVLRLHVADFEKLEQTYGVAVGDLVLDSVVSFTRGSLREMDMLARLDRGELAMLLPGTKLQDALLVGRRVQKALASAPLPIGGKELRLSIELGASHSAENDTAEAMLARAQTKYADAEALTV